MGFVLKNIGKKGERRALRRKREVKGLKGIKDFNVAMKGKLR